MTTILDTIRTHRERNENGDVIWDVIRAAQVKEDIKRAAEIDPRWYAFVRVVSAIRPHAYADDTLAQRHMPYWPPGIATALALIIPTIHGDDWDAFLNEIVALDNKLIPFLPKLYDFDWDSQEKMTQGKLWVDIIKPQILMEPNCRFSAPDLETWLFPTEWMEQVLRDDPTDKGRYVSNYHDCDDYQIALGAVVARSDLSKGAAGMCDVVLRTEENKMIGAHALNWFVDENKKFWFIEPQNDQRFAPDTVMRNSQGYYQYHVYNLSIV